MWKWRFVLKEVILIKEGELFLKGLNKKNFEAILIKNIKKKLEDCGKFKVYKEQSTISIFPIQNFNFVLALEKIKKIFGIASFAKAAVAEKNLKSVKITAKQYLNLTLKNCKNFKVSAKRSDKKFVVSSMEICRIMGEYLLNEFKNLSVNLHNPEVVVNIEARTDYVYIYAKKQEGAKGFPVGSSGEALLLLSGGIDSPVAGWMMNKRGLNLKAIHFISPPYTGSRALQKVYDLIKILQQWGNEIELYVANITAVQEEIKKNCPENILTIILRRAMIKIAQQVATDASTKEKNCIQALITGESLAQVASQTLAAINCTNSACNLPILRPLIGFDKEEIIKIAKKIETFNISTLPYEDCCTVFSPKHPKTNPKLFEIELFEKKLNLKQLFSHSVLPTIKHFSSV